MLRPGGLLRPLNYCASLRGEGPGSKTLQDRNKALESLSRVQGRGEGRFRWFPPVNNLRFLSICEAAFRLWKKQPNWRQASPGAISVVWATDSSHAYDRIDLDIFARDWRKNFLRIGFRIRFSPEVHRHRQDIRPVSLNGRRVLLYTWRSDW